MPTSQVSADLYDRLRAVENAINTHTAECNVRNENLHEWMETRAANEKATTEEIHAIKLDRAKMAGVFMALATLASALGSGGVLALFKALGK